MSVSGGSVGRSGGFLVALAVCGGSLVAACSDDDSAEADRTEVTSVADTTGDEPGELEVEEVGTVGEVEVVAVEYAFEGLPATVAPGTRFTMVNQGEEAHHMYVYLLDDEEERSADEIAALDTAELLSLFSYPPEFVLLAGPGEDGVLAPDFGDGTVTEPGRYIVTCIYDVGTFELPEEFPSFEDPHFRHGMYGEFTVG
jgi:plastocyanin